MYCGYVLFTFGNFYCVRTLKSGSLTHTMNAAPVSNKPVAPPGLQALIDQCVRVYPDQPNPLQVTTVLKYW